MKDDSSARVRLGVFELDVKAGELHQDGRTIRLQEQPFQILQMLVERVGEVVTRDDIQAKLWPNDTVVDYPHSINTAIRKLRDALDDDADEPTYIETVARRGYRLIMPVQWPESSTADGEAQQPAAAVSSAGAAAKPQESSTPVPGKTVSHYRVLNLIGGGGMGVVFRAEDLKLGRAVALKFLPEEVGSDPVALARFEREARTASSLNHPNICTIYEVEEHEDKPFIVMEYLDGMTLRDLIAQSAVAAPVTKSRKPPLSVQDVLDVGMQIADGLEAAHQQGVIHRDIKPANIFITRNRQVKILDFGLAKLMTTARETASDRLIRGGRDTEAKAPSQAKPQEEGDANLTRVGASIGTTGYMSPEQVQDLKLDARTDIFCYGLVLYELATGRRAFAGATKESFREAVLHETPTPVRELDPLVPSRLEEIINRCLEKDRNRRYQHASEVRSDLKQILREMSALHVVQAPGNDALHHESTNTLQQIADAEQGAPPVRPQPVKEEAAEPRHWGKWAVAALIVAAALAVGIGVAYRASQTAAPAGNVTIVISEFANTTGDAVFDGVLRPALAIQLEQSPFLNVLSDQRVSDTLKLMNRPASEKLTPELAREVCVRNNGRATLEGSIAAFGEHFLLTIKAVNCHTGDTIASAESEVQNRNAVLKALGDEGNQLRRSLGESLSSLEKFNQPLDEATTPSLEALQAFTQARRIQRAKGTAESIPFLQCAVELDPDFARAYAALGTSYYDLGQASLAAQNVSKAYELRYRVSQRERYYIEAAYYLEVTGELDKAVQTYSLWMETYPAESHEKQHSDLSVVFTWLGQWDKAVLEAQQSLQIAPDAPVYANLVNSYIGLNRLDDAKVALNEAHARKVDIEDLHVLRYYLAFLQGDNAAMQAQVAWASGKLRAEDWMLSIRANTEAYQGHLAKARELSQEAESSAQRANFLENGTKWKLEQALVEAEVGNADAARRAAAEALELSTGRDTLSLAALTLARAGDPARAARLAEKLDRQFPLATMVQNYLLPTISAAIALDRNDPQTAIQALSVTAPYDFAIAPFAGSLVPSLYPVYVRGLAYLRLGQGQQAAAEFQKILDHPGLALNFVTAALAHLQLGRAQAMMGDKSAARKSYEAFLALWGDADPGLPILQQAKLEYAKL